MDLEAYTNIENLSDLYKSCDVDIPRLRGLSLCSEMKHYTEDEILSLDKFLEIDCCRDLLHCVPSWSKSHVHEFSFYKQQIANWYIINNDDDEKAEINWSRIHGKHRKYLKTCIKNKLKQFHHYVNIWNKYAGRDDVLRVHNRVGGYNFFHSLTADERVNLLNHPNYIDRVDDYYDDTYSDIYLKIPKEEK